MWLSSCPGSITTNLSLLCWLKLRLIGAYACSSWRAAAATSSPIDEWAWRRRIESAFAPYGDYVHYREAAGWARDVDAMLRSVGDLIETHPAQAIALLEHAYGQANAAIQWIDDSDGYLTTIAADIGEFHLAACEAARPDPAELARRLVDLELTSERRIISNRGSFRRRLSTVR